MLNKKIASEIAVGIILLLAIVVGGVFWMQGRNSVISNRSLVIDNQKPVEKEPVEKKGVMCTQDAKLCADGSYVARAGSKCEFSACPTANKTANWQTYRNEKYGFSIKYPENWNYKLENEGACFRENGKKYNIEEGDACGIFISESTNANKQRTTVEKWVQAKKNGGAGVIISNIRVGTSDAVQVQDYLGLETVLSKTESNGLEIDFAMPNLGSDEWNIPIRTIYDSMLATFKFTN